MIKGIFFGVICALAISAVAIVVAVLVTAPPVVAPTAVDGPTVTPSVDVAPDAPVRTFEVDVVTPATDDAVPEPSADGEPAAIP